MHEDIRKIFITGSINIESRVPGIYEATEEFYANIAIQCVNTWICEVYTDFVQIHSGGGLCILLIFSEILDCRKIPVFENNLND